MHFDATSNETRTNTEQSETGSDFRVSFVSLVDEGGGDDLYFIRVRNGPVKIGRAKDVRARLKSLQCACPYELDLLGVLRGGGYYESSFHGQLSRRHLRGEWFEWAPLVVDAIRAALTDGKWRTVFGFEEIEPWDDEDWRIGSPLYAGGGRDST